MRIQGDVGGYAATNNSRMNANSSVQKSTTATQTANIESTKKVSGEATADMKSKSVDATASNTTSKPVTEKELTATFQKKFKDLLKSGKDSATISKEADKLFKDYSSNMQGLYASNGTQDSGKVDKLTKMQKAIDANNSKASSFEDSISLINRGNQNRNNFDIAVKMNNNIANAANRANDVKNIESEQMNQRQISQTVLAQANQASQAVVGVMN